MLLGDSFANADSGMVDVMADAAGVTLVDYTMDDCAPILGTRNSTLVSYAANCRARNDFAYDYIEHESYPMVVLAALMAHGP